MTAGVAVSAAALAAVAVAVATLMNLINRNARKCATATGAAIHRDSNVINQQHQGAGGG